MKIEFFGGAGTVTGSKTLITHNDTKILIDCGLFQGLRTLRRKNWESFGFDVREIDHVILTHGHLDHVGALPLLCKQGYRGPIHCTPPTRDIAEVVMTDSAIIAMGEANHAKRHGYSRHTNPRPLYTTSDVGDTIPLMTTHDRQQWTPLTPDIQFQFIPNGHIFGSCAVQIRLGDQTVVCSGDIGRYNSAILPAPVSPDFADIVIMESTYGNRLHPQTDVEDELAEHINEAAGKGGQIMIPSFAVERTQELLYHIRKLKDAKRIPDIPVYLDSPMGINITDIMTKHPHYHTIGREECHQMKNGVKMVHKFRTTLKAIEDPSQKIIIAGSGMLSGGRILAYLEKYLDDPKSTLIFSGYQAVGTRGRDVLNGFQMIKFFGNMHAVKLNIRSMSTLSGHGDQKELLKWLKGFKTPPKAVLLNHGESEAAQTLQSKILHKLKETSCDIANMETAYTFDGTDLSKTTKS